MKPFFLALLLAVCGCSKPSLTAQVRHLPVEEKLLLFADLKFDLWCEGFREITMEKPNQYWAARFGPVQFEDWPKGKLSHADPNNVTIYQWDLYYHRVTTHPGDASHYAQFLHTFE